MPIGVRLEIMEIGKIAGGRWSVAGGRWPVAGSRWSVAGSR